MLDYSKPNHTSHVRYRPSNCQLVKALEGRVCPLPTVDRAEAAHVPCTHPTSSLHAIQEMLAGNRASQQHCITAESMPTWPTGPFLVAMPASSSCPALPARLFCSSSASPLDSSVCRLPLSSGRAQAKPRTVDLPSKGHLPQTRVSVLRPART